MLFSAEIYNMKACWGWGSPHAGRDSMSRDRMPMLLSHTNAVQTTPGMRKSGVESPFSASMRA